MLCARDDVVALPVLYAHVDKPDVIAVGAVCEANLKHTGIFLCLSHTFRHILLIALCLNNSQFLAVIFQNIVGFLRMLRSTFLYSARRNLVCSLFVEYL